MSVRTGNLLYTAGHLPISLDGELTTGKVKMKALVQLIGNDLGLYVHRRMYGRAHLFLIRTRVECLL